MELIYISCFGTAGLLALSLADFLWTKIASRPNSPAKAVVVGTRAPAREDHHPPLRRAA